MDFSSALGYLKAGRRVRRGTRPWLQLLGDNVFRQEGVTQPYLSTEDLLAVDWSVEPLASDGLVAVNLLIGESDVIFSLSQSHGEILRLSGDGGIYVRGRLIEKDSELVDGLREFLVGVKKVPQGEGRIRFERILDDD